MRVDAQHRRANRRGGVDQDRQVAVDGPAACDGIAADGLAVVVPSGEPCSTQTGFDQLLGFLGAVAVNFLEVQNVRAYRNPLPKKLILPLVGKWPVVQDVVRDHPEFIDLFARNRSLFNGGGCAHIKGVGHRTSSIWDSISIRVILHEQTHARTCKQRVLPVWRGRSADAYLEHVAGHRRLPTKCDVCVVQKGFAAGVKEGAGTLARPPFQFSANATDGLAG